MPCYFEEFVNVSLTERHKLLSKVATTALQIHHMILNTYIYIFKNNHLTCVKMLFCAKNNIFIVVFYVLEGQCGDSKTWDGAAIIYETNNQMNI